MGGLEKRVAELCEKQDLIISLLQRNTANVPQTSSHPIVNEEPPSVPVLEDSIIVTDELLELGLDLRSKCGNIGHFVAVVVCNTFTIEELKRKNCNGKKGKARLDSQKL